MEYYVLRIKPESSAHVLKLDRNADLEDMLECLTDPENLKLIGVNNRNAFYEHSLDQSERLNGADSIGIMVSTKEIPELYVWPGKTPPDLRRVSKEEALALVSKS